MKKRKSTGFGRTQRKRKSWSFERLEDRLVFSVDLQNLPTVSFSNATASGAALTLAYELRWAQLMAASKATAAGGGSTQTLVPLSFPLPDDPLFASQWHLLNTGQEVGNPDFQQLFGVAGQDINVLPVWGMARTDSDLVGYTGRGVTVAVIDTGVQIGHPDLADNISPTLGFNAITGTNNGQPYPFDPITNQPDPYAGHGTSVAGLIGAVANNGKGGSGVAPDVTLVPIVLLGPNSTRSTVVAAFEYALEHGIDVTNNSWGLNEPDGRNIIPLTPDEYQVLRDSVLSGRNGLGMINVFAAGNNAGPGFGPGSQPGFGNWGSASYNPFVNSRYVIGVTGVDHDGLYANADGTFTSYPEVGPDVLIAAPTGSNAAQDAADDSGQGSGLWTTDLVGDFGYNAAPLPNGFDRDRDPLADPNYTSRFTGTSGSAAIVSGVVALMLEANPNLTWRDVQEILVRSARTTAWYESPGTARSDVIIPMGSGTGGGLATGLSAGGSSSSGATSVAAPGGGLTLVGTDWGDAPYSAFYHTLDVDNGPAHEFHDEDTPHLTLGPTVDHESDGQPVGTTALGDDTVAVPANPLVVDDEDGVVGPLTQINGRPTITLTRGEVNTISVLAPNGGELNVWIDLLGGVGTSGPIAGLTGFDETAASGDHVLTNFHLVASPNPQMFQVAIPANATLNPTFARFRLTTAAYLDSIGGELLSTDVNHVHPTNGEVEDWDVQFIGGEASNHLFTTWQTNQTGPFRDPDPFFHTSPGLPPGFSNQTPRIYQDPLANPAITGNSPDLNPANSAATPSIGNDAGRQAGHYELMPGMFANGAGYTVSQGYGAYGEQIGYAHGVVDAELAVELARQWNSLGQNLGPQTEKTVTTFVNPVGLTLPAAEKMASDGMLIPGGIGGTSGFSDYWNQYNASSPGPFANPATNPTDTRGNSYVDFVVPPSEQINVESVEVKLTVTGDPSNLDFLRMMLTSPDGTQSELNHYFSDPSFGIHTSQVLSEPDSEIDPAGDLTNGTFTWTFTTNRNWGESTNGAVVIDPVTGEPVAGPGGDPIFRNWELHVENWGDAPMQLANVEIVWHGKPVDAPTQSLAFNPTSSGSPGVYQPLSAGQKAWDQRWLSTAQTGGTWEVPMAQRIQGTIGIDSVADGQFNFNRYVQEENASEIGGAYNASAPRADSIIRRPDYTDVNNNGTFDAGTDIPNQEDFAANVDVELFRVNKTTGQVETTPTAHFLTGADGNFYFDVDPTYTWVVRIADQENRAELDDMSTATNYMKRYQPEWTITPDWFFASDHDNTNNPSNAGKFDANGQQFKPGEVLWGTSDANGDGTATTGPKPFLMTDSSGHALPPIPMAVQNINFLLKAAPTSLQFAVKGSVFADLNNDGRFNGNDAHLPNITVYVDANRDGTYEQSEASAVTDSDGNYTLQVPSSVPGTYSIGVRLPGVDWQFKSPASGAQDVALPQEIASASASNFALTAPANAFPTNAPPNTQGRILGYVFNDLNGNGMQELTAQGTQGELGRSGVHVFIDTNHDGTWQDTEPATTTASNGSFVFNNVTPANDIWGIWVDVDITNEGTANAALTLTKPQPQGHVVVGIGNGGTFINAEFGVFDRAGDDWGDLPLQTLAADSGPHHKIVAGFQLGDLNTGEVNGAASANSSADTDDGIVVIGGYLKPGINTLRVTVHGVGGYLTGWMDFSGSAGFDGFDNSEQLVWSENGLTLGKDAQLDEGVHLLQVTIPSLPTTVGQRQIAARFRWGEPGLSFVGAAQIGEVEDYFLALNPTAGDYNREGIVDQSDYVLWKKQSGQAVTQFSGADGNGDGVVNQFDYNLWRGNYGKTYPGSGASSGVMIAEPSGSRSLVPIGAGLGSGISAMASSNLSSISSLAAFEVDVSQSSSDGPATKRVIQAARTSDLPQSDLLLLDHAWADAGEAAYGHADDSFYSNKSIEPVSAGDLALAAVLNEAENWWNEV